MQVSIPTKDSKVWSQRNDGDFVGILNGTRNIDLTRKGIVKLSDRFSYIQRYNDSGSTFDECLSIVFGDFITTGTYRYWFITSDRIFTMNPDWTTFAIDITGSSPSMSIYSDGAAFNSSLWVSTSSQLCRLTTGTWTVTGLKAFANTTSPHPLEPMFNNKLAMGDKNKVHTIDSTNTVVTDAISIPADYEILWIRSTADRVFIGTRNLKGLNGKVYEWDGSSANYAFEYEIETTRILSGVLWKGTLYCYTLDGRIMRFNGNGFEAVAQLPFYVFGENVYPEGSPIQIVTQRGMITSDDEILIALNPQILLKDSISGERTYYPNAMAGVWAYNPNVGFYHKHGFTIETSGDYASSYQVKARALFKVPEDITISTTTTTYNSLIATGQVVAGDATVYNVALGLKRGQENRGVIVTQRVDSNAADETWQSIGVKFNKVYSSEDKIIVKYKLRDVDGMPMTTGNINSTNATWTSTTTFTSSDSDFANISVGDEITVLAKTGAGAMAHITSIVLNTGVYTITIDEAIGASSGTFSLIVEPWVKLGTITSSDRDFKIFPFKTKNIASSIQIKCELRGEDTEIEEIVVSSTENIKFI